MGWHHLLLEARIKAQIWSDDWQIILNLLTATSEMKTWLPGLWVWPNPALLYLEGAAERDFLEWFFCYVDGQTDFQILLMQQWTAEKTHDGICLEHEKG